MKQDNYTVVYNGITSNTVSVRQIEMTGKTYTLLLSYTSSVTASNTSSTINCSGITILHYDGGATTSSLTSSYTVNVTYTENTSTSSTKVNTGVTNWGSYTSATWTITQEKAKPQGVDFGDGVLWGGSNIGANNPWEVGKYFQWGDTVGYYKDQGAAEHSYWTTCPFNNGSSSYNSSYFASVSGTVCPGGILAPENDPATVNMGEGWRLPTYQEFEYLTANTTYQWTTLNGVNGCKFTSKTDPSKFIFFPDSGNYHNGSHDGYDRSIVWSCSLGIYGPEYAWGLRLYSIYGYVGVGDGGTSRGSARVARGVYVG